MKKYAKTTSLRSLFHLQAGIEPALPDESCNRQDYYKRNLPNQCMCVFCDPTSETRKMRWRKLP